MIMMKKIILNVISTVLIAVFSFNTCCYGLATAPASQNPLVKREVFVAMYQPHIRWATARTPDALRMLKNNHDSSGLLLSSGNYLISEELRGDDLRLLKVIKHEDIEAVMQIIAEEDRYKYQAIKELILKYFPPNEDNSLPIDLYVNHTVACAFEWLILIKDGIVLKNEIPPRDLAFLRKIEPIIMSNKNSYFTAEFWDASLRNRKIRDALNRGMRFYPVTAGDPDKKSDKNYKELIALLGGPMRWLANAHPSIASAMANMTKKGMRFIIDENFSKFFETIGTETSRHLLYFIVLRAGANIVFKLTEVENDINTEVLEEFLVLNDYASLPSETRQGIINAYKIISDEIPDYKGNLLNFQLFEQVAGKARTADEAIEMIAPLVIGRSFYPRQDYSLSKVKKLLAIFRLKENELQEPPANASQGEETASRSLIGEYVDKLNAAIDQREDQAAMVKSFEAIADEAVEKNQFDEAIRAIAGASDLLWKEYMLGLVIARMAQKKELLSKALDLAHSMQGTKYKIFALADVAACMARHEDTRADAAKIFREAISITDSFEDDDEKARYLAVIQTKTYESGIPVYESDKGLKLKTIEEFGRPNEIIDFIMGRGCELTRLLKYESGFEEKRIAVILAMISAAGEQITDHLRRQLFDTAFSALCFIENDRERARLTGDVLGLAGRVQSFCRIGRKEGAGSGNGHPL